MLTIFNRKELIVTMDIHRQAEIRDVLAQNGIDYTVKTKNLQNFGALDSQRSHIGNMGINQDYSYEYKIYVQKKDYEAALGLIKYYFQGCKEV